MARKARRRTGNRTFPKRGTLWLPFEATASLTTAGTVVQTADLLTLYFSQTGAEVPVGTTIGPIRGRWAMRPAVSSVGDVALHVEALMQLVREGGRASLAVPGVDITQAMWYGQQFSEKTAVEAASGVFVTATQAMLFQTDAMRKIEGNGQELRVTLVQNSNVDFDYTFLGTIFMRLP